MVETGDITATFGAAKRDRSALSTSCRRTLGVIYQHPLAHNLEWADVSALFSSLGSVETRPNNERGFVVGGEQHRFQMGHGKDVPADDVLAFRHMLTRAGWSSGAAQPILSAARPAQAPPDLLVTVDHHEARMYRLDLTGADAASHTIRPYDPHHFLSHLTPKDQSRQRGQRAAEDPGFYARISEALRPAGRIVLVGHGQGHSDAAQHLAAYIAQHHKDMATKLGLPVAADLSKLTACELRVLGRHALSADTGLGCAG